MSRRIGRSIPFIGTAIALATLGAANRQKGWLRGAVDTVLNAVPFVGSVKTAIEVTRGRDLLAARTMRQPGAARTVGR
jgi:hypothetical protein